MIAALNNVQLQVNISVKFRLHSMTDAQTWHGQILGIVGYDVARLHEDVDATNNNMTTNVAKKNPVSMTFLLVKCLQIELQLSQILGLEFIRLQLNSHHTLQQSVIEQQVHLEGFAAHGYAMLVVDKQEVLAHL